MLNTPPITPGSLLPCLEALYELRYPAFLAGPPGIGKSSIVRQFADTRGLKLVTLILSQIEPSDIRGLPFLDRESQRTRWLIPEFYPGPNDEGGGILFLDELPNAEPRIQVAAYQLLLDRKVGEYTLPDGWVCFAAGNRLEDNSNVYELSAALADRLVFFNVSPEPRDWLDWARRNDIAPEVMAFIQVKPDYLDGNQMQDATDQLIVPTPRSWERVSSILKREDPTAVRQTLVSGILGTAAAVEFFHVLEEIRDLPSMETLFAADPAEVARLFPRTVAGLYGLAYSVTAYTHDLPTLTAATRIFSALDKIDDTQRTDGDPAASAVRMPGAEIQTFAFELLLERAEKLGLMFDLITTPEYGAYRKRAQEIVNMASSKP